MLTRTPVVIPGGPRYAIERLDPALYLNSSYFERWLYAATQGMIAAGAFTQAEFDKTLAFYRQNPQVAPPREEDPAAVERMIAGLYSRASQRRALDIQPAFRPGDAVRTRNLHPVGHTRLPRYARGKRAVVVNYYGIQIFDDAKSASGLDEAQPLYCVHLEGRELWGDAAEPNSAVYLDMWESYLEPV